MASGLWININICSFVRSFVQSEYSGLHCIQISLWEILIFIWEQQLPFTPYGTRVIQSVLCTYFVSSYRSLGLSQGINGCVWIDWYLSAIKKGRILLFFREPSSAGLCPTKLFRAVLLKEWHNNPN